MALYCLDYLKDNPRPVTVEPNCLGETRGQLLNPILHYDILLLQMRFDSGCLYTRLTEVDCGEALRAPRPVPLQLGASNIFTGDLETICAILDC